MAGTIAALPSAINKETLATYEKQSRVELQAESGGNTKGLQAMSDMKKRLEKKALMSKWLSNGLGLEGTSND